MGWRCILLLAIMCCMSGLSGQNTLLHSLDASALPDTARIDRINDYAYTLVKAKPDSADSYAQVAIARSLAAGGYAKGLVNAHMLLGILNKDRGYYGISVENYLKALKLAEGAGDSLRVSGCLNNLGSVYYEQGNYRKALSYFQRSLAIENKIGKDKGQASIRLVNLGDTYYKLDSLDKAAAFYYNSLMIEEELKNEDGMFYARLGIGRVDTRKGNLGNARAELDRAIDYARRLQNHPGICETQIALGELLLSQQQWAPAKLMLDSALTKAREFHFQGLEVQALGSLYKVLKGQNELAAANAVLEKFYALREKLNSATVNSRIGELQTRYQLEKKEQEIALFQERERVQETKMANDRKLRNFLLFSVLVTILLIIYNNYRARRADDAS